MTIREYSLRVKAYSLAKYDKRYEFAQQALIQRQANYVENGEYKYTESSQLVNLEEIEKKIFKEPIIDDDTYNRLLKVRR